MNMHMAFYSSILVTVELLGYFFISKYYSVVFLMSRMLSRKLNSIELQSANFSLRGYVPIVISKRERSVILLFSRENIDLNCKKKSKPNNALCKQNAVSQQLRRV